MSGFGYNNYSSELIQKDAKIQNINNLHYTEHFVLKTNVSCGPITYIHSFVPEIPFPPVTRNLKNLKMLNIIFLLK